MTNPLRALVHAHAPSSLHGIRSEHVLMSSAYGLAAALAHSPVGTAAVAVGYLTVAGIGVRDQRRLERDEECTGRHATCRQPSP